MQPARLFLPLAVLKRATTNPTFDNNISISRAFVLTACGFETVNLFVIYSCYKSTFTRAFVLTACGFETLRLGCGSIGLISSTRAFVLTACGFETLLEWSTTLLE